MFSKTAIEEAIASENGTTQRSLANAHRIMHGGGYILDGLRGSTTPTGGFEVLAHFTHNQYRDRIEHVFNGFRPNSKHLLEFLSMFNVSFDTQGDEFAYGVYLYD